MNEKFIFRRLIVAIVSLMPLHVHSAQLWDDGFAGSGFNNHWSVFGMAGAVHHRDGHAIFDQGTSSSFGRAFLTTGKTQDGATTFSGNPAYDFFKHDLRVTLRRLHIPGDVTTGSINFVAAVTRQNAANSDGPRQNNAGAYLRLSKSSTELRLGMMEVNTSRPYSSKVLHEMPHNIEMEMNATGWLIRITGTTFTDGTTTVEGPWTILDPSIFADVSPSFRFGVYNESIQAASSNEVYVDGIEVFAGADNRPVAALPRIGVRQATPFAQFYNTHTDEEFLPIGTNYIKLHEYILSDGSASGIRHHSTFIEELYDPLEAEAALARMADGGFTVVRVWLYHGHWQLRANGFLSVGGPLSKNTPDLHQPYMDNFVDFLQRATRHGIYVHLVIDREPETAFYRTNRVDVGFPDIEGFIHREYMVEGSIQAKEIYVREIIRSIKDRDLGLLSTIFTYEIRNEIHANTNQKPFSLTSGIVTTAAGDYDMGDPAQRQAAYDDNVTHWLNRSIAALKDEDPDALATSSIFAYSAVGKTAAMSQAGLLPVDATPDRRWPVLPGVLMAAELDFVSFHHYISSSTWSQALESSGWGFLDKTDKPFLAGEYGMQRAATNDPISAANQLYDHRETVLDFGFRGASLFTFDTLSHFRWTAMENGAFVYERLKPKAFTSWDFARTGFNQFWTIGNSISAMETSNGKLRLTMDGADPYIISPTCRVDTTSKRYLKIKLKNETPNTQAQLFWTTKTHGGWNGARSIVIDISGNDEAYMTYIVDLSGHPEWNGIVNQLRFDPVASSPPMGRFAIESISFHQDDPRIQTYVDWARQVFPADVPEEKQGASASPAGSGIPNFLAYAFGIDPLRPERENLPAMWIESGDQGDFLMYRFRKNIFAGDLRYILEDSDDLVSWHPTPNPAHPIGDDGRIQWVEASIPVAPDIPRLFLRLRIHRETNE